MNNQSSLLQLSVFGFHGDGKYICDKQPEQEFVYIQKLGLGANTPYLCNYKTCENTKCVCHANYLDCQSPLPKDFISVRLQPYEDN